MMIMDVSKLSVEYLKLVEENFTYEMNMLKYKMNYIQNNPVVLELFIKLKHIKPKQVQFQEPPIEPENVCFTTEEHDEIIDTFSNNIVVQEETEETPVVYAYQYGANEIHKIIGTLDDTHLKVENHRGFDYQRHPDRNGYTMTFSKEPFKNPFDEDFKIRNYFIKLSDVILINSFDLNKRLLIYFDDDKSFKIWIDLIIKLSLYKYG